MKNYLLVDVNSIFHRSYSSLSTRMPNAKDIHGNPVVGTFGFFTTLFKTLNIKEFSNETPQLVFAFDCKNSTSVRKSISTDYKSNRKPKPSEFYKDLDVLLRTYIPMLGVLPLGKQGYEADDIIASSCRYISSVVEEQSSIFILSGDGDLEQCAKYENNLLSIHWIKTQPQWVVWNSSDVLNKWGVESPDSITLMKAIVGDSSDNIRGVKGYKKAKALKVYNDPSFLERYHDIISYNLSLLNFKDDLEVVPRSIDLSVDNLTNIFSQMKANSMLRRVCKLAR